MQQIIKQVLFSILVFLNVQNIKCIHRYYDCPEECQCYYFRSEWVTDCAENNLTSVPVQSLNLNSYVLCLNNNSIAEVPTFPKGTKFSKLLFANNKLTTLQEESFKELTFMLNADFSYNLITTVDQNVFRSSPGLITLELQGNILHSINHPFIKSWSLLYLGLRNCNVSDLNNNFFSLLPSLTKLDLSENPLLVLTTKIFTPLEQLQYLHLNYCNLTFIESDVFKNLENLKFLEMYGNLFVNINWNILLDNIVGLETLNLGNSNISYLSENVFCSKTLPKDLILAENMLGDLDIASALGCSLQHLETLDLSYCDLQENFSDNVFVNVTKLDTLILSNNHLSSTGLYKALYHLSTLQKLCLRNCSLTSFHSDMFYRFPILKDLDISHNRLNNLYINVPVSNAIEYLDVSFCNLAHLYKNTFSKMSHLKHLILSGNKLKYFEPGTFQNLPYLEILELNQCDLKYIPNGNVFAENNTFSHLKELQISGNPFFILDDIPFLPQQLSQLKTLDMSYCNISQLSNTTFYQNHALESLTLSHNPLGFSANQNSPYNFLQPLPQLKSLDISNCNFSTISSDDFRWNKNISSIIMTGNTWKCSCKLVKYWNLITYVRGDIGILFDSATQVTATSPEVMIGKPRKLFCEDAGNIQTLTKYVREANCPYVFRVSSPQFLSLKEERYLGRMLVIVYEMPPTWIIAVGSLTIVIFISTLISAWLGFIIKKSKKERLKIKEKIIRESHKIEEEKALELKAIELFKHQRNLTHDFETI